MKKNILLFFAALLFALTSHIRSYALTADDIISEAAVLMDAETGQIIFDKNGGKMMYPASTTKIMTGLIASELRNMDEIATVTESAVDIDEWNSSNIALSAGELLPLDSLMYGLMLPSANDAANVIAEHVAGSQQNFALMMTEKARSFGAFETHFTNAHGLHEQGHYTTARDLALITREAMKNPVFMHYFGAGTHTIPPTNLQPLERPFTNYQYMLVDTSRFYNPDVTGGKVGFTTEAMHTMSTTAERGSRTLICVVMRSPYRDDKFTDTEQLLSFGFNEFRQVSIADEYFLGFSTSILEGDSQAGIVSFKSPGGNFTGLLHNSLEPSDIQIDYTHNYPFEKDEEVAAFVEFNANAADNPAIPPLLGRLALESEIFMFTDASPAISDIKDELAEFFGRPWAAPLILFCVVAVIFIWLFISRRIEAHMRIKRRRKRLLISQQLQREQQTLYRGPTPRVTPKERLPR